MKKTEEIKKKWFDAGYRVNIETDQYLIFVNFDKNMQFIFCSMHDGFETSKGQVDIELNNVIQETLNYFEIKKSESI